MPTLGKRLIGITFWTGILAWVTIVMIQNKAIVGKNVSPLELLWNPHTLTEVSDSQQIAIRDSPIFHQAETGQWKQVGRVRHTAREENESPANSLTTVEWYAPEMMAGQYDLVVHRNSGQMREVLATLFPPAKQQRLRGRLTTAFQQHGKDFVDGLMPLAKQTIQESIPLIEREFKSSISRHRQEIDELVNRWNQDFIEPEVIPLAKEQVLPIVRLHAQPVAESIGRKLWDRASIWRFGWRAAYDTVPLPKRNLVQQEWERFIETDAIPVFESHTDSIVEAIQKTLLEVISNQAVRAKLGDGITKLSSDPQMQAIFQQVLRESILENHDLQVALEAIWKGEEAVAFLDDNSKKLEPVVRQIGEDLFGSPEDGIDPDFARVLRNQILGKDRHWLVTAPKPTQGPSQILRAKQWMPYPVVYSTQPILAGTSP